MKIVMTRTEECGWWRVRNEDYVMTEECEE